jgi:hypothetical protein
MRSRLLALAAALLAAGCAVLPSSWDHVSEAEVPDEIARAEEERAAGDHEAAVVRLLRVRKVDDLEPALRERSGELLERSSEALMERYESADAGPETFEDLFEEDGLPGHLRARAGILAADRKLALGERVAAVKLVKKVDQTLAGHTNRMGAGDVLSRAGLSLIRDRGRYGIFFTYRARGVTALEYLVQQYPLDEHCPEAFAALADHYERAGDLDLAIERHEDLVLYHPLSDQAVVSEARLPYLRLERLERDDYDRHELLRARAELARWTDRHAGHELEPWVHEVARDCDRRLTRNDLVLAAYYLRIGSTFGARIHTERALHRAEEAGLEGLVAQAQRELAALPAEAPKEQAELPEAELELPPREETNP